MGLKFNSDDLRLDIQIFAIRVSQSVIQLHIRGLSLLSLVLSRVRTDDRAAVQRTGLRVDASQRRLHGARAINTTSPPLNDES